MLTEFDLRRRISDIRSSSATPFRKARQFLALGRTVRKQESRLVFLREQTPRERDRNGFVHLDRLAKKMRSLYLDLRDEALRALARRR
jgi:hypothetical protein